MKQYRGLALASFMLVLMLCVMVIGVNVLWNHVLHYHASQLGAQVKSTLVRDVSEGNYFEISATLDRLRMAGLYDQIAVVDTNNNNIQWVYASEITFQNSADTKMLVDTCLTDGSNHTTVAGNQVRYAIKLRGSPSPIGGVCAIVSSTLSDDLLSIRSTVVWIFVIIASLVILALTFLLLRMSRQELALHEIEATKQIEKAEALGKLASQVSHDIRSPLSALNMVISRIDGLPEEPRLIVRSAVQRINDIANQLLKNSRESLVLNKPQTAAISPQSINESSEPILLPALVDMLVSEKRVQFREKPGVIIEFDTDGAYGVFISFPSVELNRILSNLINNSVEAFSRSEGTIRISLRRYTSQIQLVVSDDGCGIPSSILDKIGMRGFSYGKHATNSGSGLGLYHAKTLVKAHGGVFDLSSKQGQGTIISMTFPPSPPPSWFCSKLNLSDVTDIVVVDDDTVIHEIWRKRFEALSSSRGVAARITNFSTMNAFINQHNSLIPTNCLFLVDYEFLGQSTNGLDLIEKLEIATSSVLVTSRYDETHVRERCQRLGVRIIPKSMAPFVPVKT